MPGVPAPLPGAGPGVVTLRAAARSVRTAGAQAASLSPDHWRAPSAEQYRRQIRQLGVDAGRAADQIDRAVLAAQAHAAELEHVRLALLSGSPVPR